MRALDRAQITAIVRRHAPRDPNALVYARALCAYHGACAVLGLQSGAADTRARVMMAARARVAADTITAIDSAILGAII